MLKIDIILLTFNEIKVIDECVSSLYSYSENFNLFIFDNGSVDGTTLYLKELLKNKDNVDVYFNDSNIGIIKGRNLSYDLLNEKVSMDYIMFLDADQIVREGWQNSYSNLIEQGYDSIGSEAWRMNDLFYPCYKCKDKEDSFTYIGCGGMLIKKDVIDKIGLFDTTFGMAYFEDPDFCFRAYEYGYKIAWCPNKIIHKPHRLLDIQKKKYFFDSYKIFKEKHAGKEIPVFRMTNT